MLLQIYGDLFEIMIPLPAELVVVEQQVEERLVQLAVASSRVVAQPDPVLNVWLAASLSDSHDSLQLFVKRPEHLLAVVDHTQVHHVQALTQEDDSNFDFKDLEFNVELELHSLAERGLLCNRTEKLTRHDLVQNVVNLGQNHTHALHRVVLVLATEELLQRIVVVEQLIVPERKGLLNQRECASELLEISVLHGQLVQCILDSHADVHFEVQTFVDVVQGVLALYDQALPEVESVIADSHLQKPLLLLKVSLDTLKVLHPDRSLKGLFLLVFLVLWVV